MSACGGSPEVVRGVPSRARLLRWLSAVVVIVLALAACSSCSSDSDWRHEAGPFPVGNLLNYANSDFEGHANFIGVANATINDSSSGFLHSDSLQDTVVRRGTSTFRLHTGIGIGLSGGSTYTVSAYVRLSSASSGQALTFGLACVTSAGTRLGWSYTPTLALVGEQTWQYAEGQTTVPSTCAEGRRLTEADAQRHGTT